VAAPRLPPRYEPIAPLGKGGGGEVWSVRDRITGRTVALKALREDAEEREVLALVREAVALSGVEGLGVPRVLRFGRLPLGNDGARQSSAPARWYMVRELVEGSSLADLLDTGDPLRALVAIAQAADQLTRLHRASLLHGDIKPANIIVGEAGRATLVDLGLAATWREGGARLEGLTPRYAAPELFDGVELTVRAEVYALGATIQEAVRASEGRLAPELASELEPVIARATAEDPNARFPSADELANALRRAAHLPEPPEAPTGIVWPVVGLDGPTSRLLDRITALEPGGAIVLTGPKQSGRSTLLRRIAWSLGVEGHPVAWIEAASAPQPREAIDIELTAHGNLSNVVALIDDADRLSDSDFTMLDEVRSRGGRMVMVTQADAGPMGLGGRSFEVFPIPPLDDRLAGELVRRTIPSLSDAVVAHVVARAEGWPGRIRAIVVRLERSPVVAPADVDRLLEVEPVSALGVASEPEEIHRLLDCGHFEEAAALLERHADNPSPVIAIARARLATNRGDTTRALAELSGVRRKVEAGGDRLVVASLKLYASRAHLRAGDYGEAERSAHEACDDLGVAIDRRRGSDAPSLTAQSAGSTKVPMLAMPLEPKVALVAAEAVSVCGLAQSYASRHVEAKVTLEHSVELARAAADPRILSVTLASLAFALQRDGQLAEAKVAYEEALGAAELAADAGGVATTRLNLAGILKRQGDLAGAIRHLEAAVDMGRRSGRMATLRQALLNLANLDHYLGRLARARVSIDDLAAQRGDLPPQMQAQLLALEAEHAARSGNHSEAERLCTECAEAYDAMGRSIDAAEARLERVLVLAGRPEADADALKREIVRAETALGTTTAHRALLSIARGRVATLLGDEQSAREAFDEALEAGRVAGQRDWMWRALEARASLELRVGQSLKAKRDREAALAILEEIAARLPRDLREVYWNDPRRHALRASCLLELASGPTMTFTQPSEDRLVRILEVNHEIAGEHDLQRLLDKVTDHAIALLRAERGFVILRSGYRAGMTADGKADDLSIHASRDQSGDDPHARFSRSIADRVIGTGEPVVTASAREDARMADYVSVHQLMLQSVACVPIRSRKAGTIGALYLETRLRPAATFSEEIPTVMAFADQVAIAIETARLVGENERRARELEKANAELKVAQAKLEELLGHRTAQLAATRRDLRSARAVLRSHFGYEGLVGTSQTMRRLYALIDRVKDTDVPILIVGESGTGKEVVARAVHNAGPRSKKPFVGINCGAIPEHLLESELFGHVRGAFTGADRDRRGLFREATEGTILLDEIGEMPPKMQAGLLRVLQEKVVRPVGGAREEPVDTRVIAATHRDLSRMVEEGSFREDLYYRLHVIEVRVPPLRERLDDVPVLIDHFLGIFAARYGRERRSVSRSALKRLMAYGWPGNVRQLENVLLNAWVLSDRPELESDDFELPDSVPRPLRSAAPLAPSDVNELRSGTSLDVHKAEERERILLALSSCNWNRVKAAEMVGLPRRTFYRRLKEYGIQ
jgi:transcriptional regulator with GAF, ATPase, and Fis domain